MALPRVLMKVYEFLNDRLALDYRSLALFRFGLGAIIFIDCIGKFSDAEAFYTDFGIVPRSDLINIYGNYYKFSFHMASGELWFQWLLLSIYGLLAFLLMIGFKTRRVLFFTWLLSVSLQARNPLVLQGGDYLLSLLLFFGFFLPLGSAFSVDKALDNSINQRPGYKIFNLATLALTWQVMLMYFCAALEKTGYEWQVDGSAVYYALNVDTLTNYLGEWVLKSFAPILPVLSFGTLYLEAFGPLLFITPFWSGPLRTLGVLLFVALHVGFGLTMELGDFPWIDSFAVMALLPTWFWDKIFGWLKTPERTGLKIYYDGECNFCKKPVSYTHLTLPTKA